MSILLPTMSMQDNKRYAITYYMERHKETYRKTQYLAMARNGLRFRDT